MNEIVVSKDTLLKSLEIAVFHKMGKPIKVISAKVELPTDDGLLLKDFSGIRIGIEDGTDYPTGE